MRKGVWFLFITQILISAVVVDFAFAKNDAYLKDQFFPEFKEDKDMKVDPDLKGRSISFGGWMMPVIIYDEQSDSSILSSSITREFPVKRESRYDFRSSTVITSCPTTATALLVSRATSAAGAGASFTSLSSNSIVKKATAKTTASTVLMFIFPANILVKFLS